MLKWMNILQIHCLASSHPCLWMIEIPVEDLNHQVKLISVCGDTIGLQDFHPKRTEIVQKQRQLCASLSLSRFFSDPIDPIPFPSPATEAPLFSSRPPMHCRPHLPSPLVVPMKQVKRISSSGTTVGIAIIPSRFQVSTVGREMGCNWDVMGYENYVPKNTKSRWK